MRFLGFEEPWVKARLGDVTEKINSGKTPLGGESNYLTEGVPFIRSQNVNNDQLELENIVYISDDVNAGMKNSVVRANDILLNITGASLGRSCVVPEDFEVGNVNQHVCIVRPKKQYNPRFIQPILGSSRGQAIFESLQTGSGREGLNFESIKKIELDFPSFPEQKKIADFLSLIDRRIQTQNKIIGDLETSIKKLRDKLFTQELRFKGFVEQWGYSQVNRECIINPKSPPLANQFAYIDLESVTKGELTKKLVIEKTNAPSRASRVLEDWDILFQCVRPYQQNNFLYRRTDETQWVASTGYAQIRTKHDPYFIYHAFNHTEFGTQVMMRCTGTSYPAISGTDFGEISISICSIPEQQKIGRLLSLITKKMIVEKKVLAAFEKQKKYLLGNLFTGD